jgi:hypothetical protein
MIRADRSQEEQDFIYRIKLWEEQVQYSSVHVQGVKKNNYGFLGNTA